MNRFLKLLMLVLIFGVLVGAVFAVGAFAEDEKATTVTYKIPEGNTDIFLLFDAKTGDFIRSSNNFYADSECLQDGVDKNDNILDETKFVNKESASYYILMRDDYEVTTMWQKTTSGGYVKTAGHYNFFHLYANIVVDLGGNTLTFSTYLGAQTKGTDGAGLNFTFTNGKIVNNNTTKDQTYIFGFSANKKNRSCHLTFDDVTFEVAQGTTPTYWVTNNSKGSKVAHLDLDVTYKNCTFDTTNLTKTTYVSILGATTEDVTGNLEFIDCDVTGANESYFAPTYIQVEEGNSITCSSTDERWTPYGYIPSAYASVENYPFVLFNAKTRVLLWQGTKWGGENKTADGKPDGLLYAIFNNRTKNTIAYLRRNLETTKDDTAFYNHGNVTGTHVIDLGNHTIKATYGSYFFYEQLKSKAADLFITVKNGTFDLANKAQLMYLSGGSYCHNQGEVSDYMYDPDTHTIYKSSSIPDAVAKADTTNDTPVYYYTSNVEKNMTYLFENVKFKNLGAEKYLIYEGRSTVKELTANIRFKNCDIEYSGARTAPLFYYGQSGDSTVKGFYRTSNGAVKEDYDDSASTASGKYIHPTVMKSSVDYKVDIILEGGSITNSDGTSVLALTTVPKYHADKKSITLEKGENGKYTTYTTQSSVNVDSAEYTTAGGTYYLRQTAEAGTTKTYVFSKHGFVSTYLNLESDLNMVYRVFLPATVKNPTVTFTVGGFENVVTSMEEKDENGLYLFKLPAINAALMGETITATLTTEDGSVSGTLDYTIEAYLEAVKKQYSDEATQNLVEALFVYGAAAEQYTGASTEVGELDLDPVPKTAYTVVKEGTAISQFAMNINGTFFLRVGITLDAGTDMSAMKLVATKGEKVTTYDLSSYTAGNMIAITYDEITALELDENVTFELMNGEEEISSIAFSANSYLFRAEAYAQTNPTLVALTRAIYWYGVAAEAYQKAKT